MYRDILNFYQDDYRMKMKKSVLLQGQACQWFLYAQISERFKYDKKMTGFDQSMSTFEIELCTYYC